MSEVVPTDMAAYPQEVCYDDPENRACDSNATAYLMYKIGAPNELWYPGTIDAISGRMPDEPTEVFDSFRNLLALLEQGAEIIEISPFESKRLIHEGLPYLEEFCADDWLGEDPADFYSYWTPENVDKYTQAYIDFEERAKGEFRQSFQTIHSTATEDDLRRFRSQEYDIKCLQADEIGASIVHAVVVTDIEDHKYATTFSIFDPSSANMLGMDEPIFMREKNDFIDLWRPTEGIFAVRKSAEA